MIPLGPVVARSRMRAARTGVWSFVSDPVRRAEWWPELELETRIGGRIAERWSEGSGDDAVSRDAAGQVDVWVEGHAVGFTWREAGDTRDTAVLLTLRSQAGETGVTVTETGFDALPAPAERAAASQQGWEVLLAALAKAIDAGVAAGIITAEDPPAPAAPDAEAPSDETVPVARLPRDDSDSAPAGAIELAPEEVDGEVFETESELVLEVDAEPQLGEHLELDTGSVQIINAEDADDDAAADGSTATDTETEAAESDALAEPVADAVADPQASDEATDLPKQSKRRHEPEADSFTGDPDFDALIRGL